MHGEYMDDIMTMKLAAADGEILWRVFSSDGSHTDDRAWAIVVGPDDHPVVTGILSTMIDPARYRTVKLDNADGSEIWGHTLPGAINHIDREAGWLAACDNGDVIMANRTWGTTTGYDVVLHRYAAADGDTLWKTIYDSGSDDLQFMTRDAAGDLLVVGVRSGDYMVLKFDEYDGSLIWSEDYDGPAGFYDAAASVVEGPSGEVIVTGFSTGDGTSWDATTAAFDPADGTFLWDVHFDSGEGRSDEGKALAVSAQGDLYVTGYADRLATVSDLLAIRYSLVSSTGVAGPPVVAAPLLAIRARPNPFIDRLSLSIDGAGTAHARVAVYDVRGRRAALLHDGPISAGGGPIDWDGRDDSGRLLTQGIYFVRLESGGMSAVKKVLLSR